MLEPFWEKLCPLLPIFKIIFFLSVFMAVLLAFTLPFVERGAPAFYITVATLVPLTLSLAGSGVVIRKCRRMQK